jgi:hypothetical protein
MNGLLGSVEVDGETLSLAEAQVDLDGAEAVFTFEAPSLCWTRRVEERGGRLVLTSHLENTGEADLSIGNWNLLSSEEDGCVELGPCPEQVRFFGWRSWAVQVERFSEEESNHTSSNLCHLTDPASGTVLLCAFISLDRMLVNHTLCYARGRGATGYRASCSAGGYRLRPGQVLEGEVLEVTCHRDPYQALEGWGDRVHAHYQPKMDERPLVIWNGGAWLDGFSEGEDDWESMTLDNCRALNEKLTGFDVTHVWTSQKNQKDGLPGNWLTGNEKLIPSGMPGFLKKVADLGIGHKLWFSPFWFFAEAEGILEENRENLLVDQSGDPITEAGSWEWDVDTDAAGSPRLTKYYLDGTHPKTKAYVSKVFRAYREMGADAYMLDFLAIKEGARLHDDTLLPVEAARAILSVIKDAGGDDVHLQTAVASTPGFIGLLSSARVVRDFGEGRPLYPPFPLWHNATYVRHDEHFGAYHSFVQNAAANWFTHNRIYCNDLNMLTLDKPVPLEQARIGVTLFGLTGGSPLTLGDDYRNIDPERLNLVKLCLPRSSGVPIPVDLFENVAPESYCRMLKLEVRTDWDDYLLVAVYNNDPGSYEGELDFARLGLEAEAAYRVYEFWNGSYEGTFKEHCPVSVPSESIRLYRIHRARPHPWLLATDMHIQQGAVEVETLEWNEPEGTLSGVVSRPAGESGHLFLHLPREWRLVDHSGVRLMKEVLDMSAMACIPIRFESDRVEFSYRFERLDVPNVCWRWWLPYRSVEEWQAWLKANRDPDDTRVIELDEEG